MFLTSAVPSFGSDTVGKDVRFWPHGSGFNPRHNPGSTAACLFPCEVVETMFQGK